MTVTEYEINIRTEMTRSLAAGFARTAAAEFAIHGDDPNASVIIATALVLFINGAEETVPGMRGLVKALLTNEV